MLTSRLWISLLHLWDKCVSAADRRSTTKAAIWCGPPLLCAGASWVFSLYRSDVWSACVADIDVFAPRHQPTRYSSNLRPCRGEIRGGTVHSASALSARSRDSNKWGGARRPALCAAALNAPHWIYQRFLAERSVHPWDLLLRSTVICRKHAEWWDLMAFIHEIRQGLNLFGTCFHWTRRTRYICGRICLIFFCPCSEVRPKYYGEVESITAWII